MTATDQNVLREDLPLPLCVLRATALERNVTRFQRYTESAGIRRRAAGQPGRWRYPAALTHVRRGTAERHPLRDSGWQMTAVSDQHAHMTVPTGHGVEVGDLIALGPSHPCTTFDKWRVVHLVDDDYNLLEAIQTYF